MTPEVLAALDRVQSGRSGPADIAILQRALLGMAPSSPEYRQIAGLIATQSPTAVDQIPGREDQGPGIDLPWDPESRPTGDWAAQMIPGSPAATTRAAETMQQGPTRVTPPPGRSAGGWLDQFVPGSDAATGRAAETMRQGPTKADELGLTGIAGQVANQQANQGGGGGNPLNTDVQGGHQLDWDPEGSIESFSPYPHSRSAEEVLMAGPEGYTFSEMNPAGVSMLHRNPSLYLNQYAKERGGGEAMASFLDDPRALAEVMSSTGLLGQSYRSDLSGGIYKTSERTLSEVEDFLNAYNQPGMAVNTGQIYQDMLSRAGATEFLNPETGLAMTPDEIIGVTNQVLASTTKVLPQANQEQVLMILNQAGQEYMLKVASGEIDPGTVSYPKYLEQQGLRTLLG